MDFRRSRRRWLRVAGLAITACVLGLYAWGTMAGYQQRLATAAEHAAVGAFVIDERVQRVLDRNGTLDLASIEPLLAELAGSSGIAALLNETGEVVTAQPSQPSSAWIARPMAERPLLMPLSVVGVERSDGTSFIAHYRPVAGWPLTAIVAVSKAVTSPHRVVRVEC